MRAAFPIRLRGRRGMRGLGSPVLPDSWAGWAFSPGTPDATIIATLKQFGASLPPDLQAKWDAAQATSPAPVTTPNPSQSPANPAPGALTPSGQPISTQTGQAITLANLLAVQGASGVFQCVMSDGSSHYCDVAGQPISYTPPAPTPVTTPAASSQPTSTVSPSVSPVPSTPASVTVVAVTPAGGQISTTTGTPTSADVIATVQGEVESLMTWLKGSLIGGVPNWLLLGGAVTGLLMFSGDGQSSRRRR